MDPTLLYLALGFLVSALYFEWRMRRIWRTFAPRALGALQTALLVKNVSKSEDGTERVVWAPTPVLEAFLSATVPVMVAVALKNVKLKLPAGLPPDLDMSKLSEALPQLIMAMPGRNLSLGGFKVPKEIAAALSSLIAPFLPKGGTKPGGKETPNPFLKEGTP